MEIISLYPFIWVLSILSTSLSKSVESPRDNNGTDLDQYGTSNGAMTRQYYGGWRGSPRGPPPPRGYPPPWGPPPPGGRGPGWGGGRPWCEPGRPGCGGGRPPGEGRPPHDGRPANGGRRPNSGDNNVEEVTLNLGGFTMSELAYEVYEEQE